MGGPKCPSHSEWNQDFGQEPGLGEVVNQTHDPGAKAPIIITAILTTVATYGAAYPGPGSVLSTLLLLSVSPHMNPSVEEETGT